MQLKITLLLFALGFIQLTFAQTVSYDLRMEKPENHYFQVEMQVKGWKKKELDIHLPIWAPGSYLAREFAKNVNLVKAFDENGTALEINKTSKKSMANCQWKE
ncbi:MAG: hypothetical protein KJ941_12790 [Bacteroidetes bacterium]|nr:hypothetical protein [Bacteroidota bacterium]